MTYSLALLGMTQTEVMVGLVTGLIYAALGAGLVLIYRSTGVLNFAHGEIGALSLAFFAFFNVNWGWQWWIAFAAGVFLGALSGMLIELMFVRRLFESPRLVLLIATIGVTQVLTAIKINLPQVISPGPIPSPVDWVWEPTDSLRINAREMSVVLIVPLLIAALALFLTKTKLGLRVRASAANPDTARVYGISPRKTSTIVWTVAGAFAAATTILIAPVRGINAAQAGTVALGAPLLLRALAVGLIARMRSLPMTLVGGLVVGVTEAFIKSTVSSTNKDIVDLFLLLAILVSVLFASGTRREIATWSLSPKVKSVPVRLQGVWWVRNINVLGLGLLFAFLAVIGLLTNSSAGQNFWASVLVSIIIVMSVTVLTGWAGQLSLGQFAFAGIGGLTMVGLTWGHPTPGLGTFELNWFLAAGIAMTLGVLTAFIVGLPALRATGLFLAVVTLALAVMSSSWLFSRDFFASDSGVPRPVPPPDLGFVDLAESRRAMYFAILAVLLVVCVLTAHLRQTGIGRSIIAARENEEMAAASTVSVARAKLIAFSFSGGIAALGGALLVTIAPSIQPTTLFGANLSIDVVAMAVIGGLGSIAGPFLGALFVRGIPAMFDLTSPPETIRLVTSSIGLLFLLMYFPGGLLQIVYRIREAIFSWADSRLEQRGVAIPVPAISKAIPARPAPLSADVERPLVVNNVNVRFGGNRAVNDVSLHVNRGELVGLIGSNGAGKSTLMNAISGFVPSTGSIEVNGHEVSNMPAHKRHRLGLGRGFQAARLYPDLSVRESIMVSLEARAASQLFPSLTGIPPSPKMERAKRSEADELVDFLGLGRYADEFISALSTGTRRIVELGSLLAVNASVLMLDEPTGGVAQKETEAFGPLIKRIQHELEASVVVIEHDMPLIMSISDRVYCLESGAVIAEGNPTEVRNNPLVIATYLGTDERAIARSDA